MKNRVLVFSFILLVFFASNYCQAQSQEQFAFTAKNHTNWEIRKMAVKKLKNNQLLAEIANNDENEKVRKAAIRKIKDPIILKDVANNGKYFNIRQQAYKKLGLKDSSEALYDVIYNHPRIWSRESATKKLNDKNLLFSISKDGENIVGARLASEKFLNLDTIAYLSKNANHWEIRAMSLLKLNYIDREKLFVDIAKNDEHNYVRKIAIANLDSIKYANLLSDFAKNDTDEDIRKEAINKLENQIVLAEIAKNETNKYVRKEAVRRITDPDLLVGIYNNDPDSIVKIEAIRAYCFAMEDIPSLNNEMKYNLQTFSESGNLHAKALLSGIHRDSWPHLQIPIDIYCENINNQEIPPGKYEIKLFHGDVRNSSSTTHRTISSGGIISDRTKTTYYYYSYKPIIISIDFEPNKCYEISYYLFIDSDEWTAKCVEIECN